MEGISETKTLGDIIDWLGQLPLEDEVIFDFCGASPISLDSSRGDYSELALAFSFDQKTTVGQMLEWCKAAVGSTFMGYKGGHYTMDRHTQVWVDQYGKWTGTAIKSLEREGHGYGVIRTELIR